MNHRTLVLAIMVIALALTSGCTRTTDPYEPTSDILSLSQTESNIIALTAMDHFDLTPEQREKLNALMKKHQEAVQVLIEEHKKGNISREELHARIQALEKELEEQIKLILTPEQFEKWKQHQEHIRQFGGLPYPLLMPLEHLARILELDERQVQQARAIVEKALEEMRTAVQTIADRKRLHEVIAEIVKRAEAQFRSILTDAQKAKYDQLKRPQPVSLPYPLPFPLEHLTRALSLTPAQVDQAKAIIDSASAEIRNAFQTITDKSELSRVIEQILKNTDAAFQNILTEQQRLVYARMKNPQPAISIPYPLILPLEHLVRILALTSEQTELAKAIVEDALKEMRAAAESVKNKDELRAMFEAIMKRADSRFRALLTAEQAAKYDQLKKPSHQPRYPYPLILPLETLARELALTRDQVQKASAIVETAMREIRQAVDTINDKNELQKVLEQIMMRTDAQFTSILTSEQIIKYEAIKKKVRVSGG